MPMKTIFLLLSIITCVSPFTFAVDQNPQKNNFHFQHFNKHDGLTNNQISDIFQDSHGFLWVATYEGLNRFDGIHFINVEGVPTTGKQQPLNFINVITEDHNENLWVGTSSGIAKVSINNHLVSHYPLDDEYEIYVNDILILDKQLWVATSNGLFKFLANENKFEKVSFFNSSNQEILNVLQVTADQQGNIWLLDELLGPFKITQSQSVAISIKEYISTADLLTNVSAIWFDNSHELWIGSNDGRVQVIDLKLKKIIELPLPFDEIKHRHSATIKSFVSDNQGNIWIGTMGKGLYIISKNDKNIRHLFHSIHLDFSLSDNAIWTLYRDKNDKIWLGSDTSGISLYDPTTQHFNSYFPDPDNQKSIRDKVVWAAYQDSNKQYWIGGDNGIDVLNDKREKQYSLLHSPDDKGSLTDNRIFNIIETNQGDMWISTQGGLNKFTPKTQINKRYIHQANKTNSLPSNITGHLFIDSNHQLWIGTERGSVIYHPESDDFLTVDKLTGFEVYGMVETAPQIFWLATAEQGVLYYNNNNKKFKHYLHDPSDIESLSDNKTTSILYQNNHVLGSNTARFKSY